MIVLRDHYKISHYWEDNRYLGMDLDWYYANRKVHPSMLAYVSDALTGFSHKHPHKLQLQPYPHINPTYCAKVQYAETTDVFPPLSKEDMFFAQEITGTFLYYARAVDPTMLTALGSIAAQRSNPTDQTMHKL